MSDLWDWADVAAVGVVSRVGGHPVWMVLDLLAACSQEQGYSWLWEHLSTAAGIRYGWAECSRTQSCLLIKDSLDPLLNGIYRRVCDADA